MKIGLVNGYDLTSNQSISIAARVGVANRGFVGVSPSTGLTLGLTSSSKPNVTPLTSISIGLVNPGVINLERNPSTRLMIGLLNSYSVQANVFVTGNCKVGLVPNFDVYGWAYDGDREATSYGCTSRNTTDWEPVSKKEPVFTDKERPSTDWTSNTKRETVYHG